MKLHGLLTAATICTVACSVSASEPTLPDWIRFELRPLGSSSLADDVSRVSKERRAELLAGDFPIVEKLRRYAVTLNEDGLMVERVVVARHFLSDEGVREHGNMIRTVRSQVTDVVVEEAWVRLPDGRLRAFDPGTLQIVENADPDVFSDSQILTFVFPNLEPGATAVLVLREETRTSSWPLHWSRMYFPQTFAPTERFEVDLAWDPDAPELAPVWATDDSKLHCARSPGALSCSRHQVAPIAFDPEVHWADELPHLVVGAARLWSDLVMREQAIVAAAVSHTEGIADAISDLELDGASAQVRIERIHRFVADEVRYVGFEHGSSAVVPHGAGDTLSRGYGDCKDKVALFIALMRGAGLDAFPVLVSTDRYSAEKLISPSWLYFNHMIACVPRVTGRTVCIDLTDPYSGTGFLPAGVEGAVALALQNGVTQPAVIPASKHIWKIAIHSVNELECSGDITETLERKYSGAGAAIMRSVMSGMNATERMRWLKEGYAEVMGADSRPEFELEGLAGSGPALTIRSKTRFDRSSTSLDIVEWVELDAWMLNYGASFKTENIHHPYLLNGVQLTTSNEYRICPQLESTDMGAVLDFRAEYGALERHYEQRPDGSVVVFTRLDLPRRLVAQSDLQHFNRFLDRALGQTRIRFALRASEANGGGIAE